MPCARTLLRLPWGGFPRGAVLPTAPAPGDAGPTHPCPGPGRWAHPQPPAVVLPPEKAEAREGPGQLFCLDDGERAASREGARGLGKRRLNVDVGLCPEPPPVGALMRGPCGSWGGRPCWAEGSPGAWPEVQL